MRSQASGRGGAGPRELLATSGPATRSVVAAVVWAAVAQAALLAWVLVLAWSVDAVFRSGADLGDISGRLVAMGALLLLRAGALWSSELSAQRGSDRLRLELRAGLARTMVTDDPRRLSGDGVGRESALLVEGVEDVGRWVTSFVRPASMVVVGPVLVFGTVAVLDPLSTLILLFTGPMLVVLLALIGRKTAELTRRRFDELGWLRGFYLDLLAGLGTLKAFGRSEDGAELVEDSSRRFGDTTMDVLRTAFQTSLVMEWAATAATALVAVEVSFRLVGGSLSFGTALAVLVLTPEFFVPFRRLAVEYHAGQAGDAASSAIVDVLGESRAGRSTGEARPGEAQPSDPAGGDGQAAILPAPPRVELRAVGYTYPGSAEPTLDGLDLEIHPGETLALVGPSGAGKSTVASLLLRFVDPRTGSLSVDGTDSLAADPRAWRRRIAWVPQHPTVFSGTVAQNIAFGEPDADRDRIIEAADRAGATEFIEGLPDGFDTVLGERGGTLSGGQRQRLAIARAVLRDAPFVVLDEFTAHLDPDTERQVLAAAWTLLQDRTALVIAHRIATATGADRIAVLEAGRVVETGTPDALTAAGGAWAELSRTGEEVRR